MRLLITAALLGVVLALTGCGSSASPGVAHLSAGNSAPSSTRSDGSAASPESPPSPQQTALIYARCMRSSGLPGFPDPNADGTFHLQPGAGIDPSSPAFRAAQAKCQKLLPGGGPPAPGATTNPSPQTLAKMLNIARCMRRHGIFNFPDPRTSVPANPFGSGGRGVISDIEGVILVFPSTIDEQSLTFTHAASTCAFPLHNR
jgi:hypothetical protein